MNIIWLTIPCVILIGIIDWIKELRRIRKEEHEINKFCEYSEKLVSELDNGNSSMKSETIKYLLSNYKYISRIIPEEFPHTPVYRLGIKIRSNDAIDTKELVRTIICDAITSIEEHERKFSQKFKQWWNIFDHFFRGISTLLKIIFGYPIQKINPEFDFHSKSWKMIEVSIGFISAIATLIGALWK